MKYFSSLNSQLSSQKGFTLIEVIVVMAIFAVLVGLATVSLSNFERTSSLASEVNKIIPDIKQQQIKAMSGDTEGSGTPSTYGIYVNSNSYTLFRGTYSAGNSENLVVNLASNIQLSTGMINNQIMFSRGSGELSNFDTVNVSNNFVTFTDTLTGNTRTMIFNKYGVITSIQ